MKKLNFKEVNQAFTSRGYELLETSYKNNRTRMLYKCPLHPDKKIYINYSKLCEGQGCPYCANRGSCSIEEVKQAFCNRGYELLENEYLNSKTKMHYRCLDHPDVIATINWNNFQQGSGCPLCAGNVSHDINIIRKEFDEASLELLSTEYHNIHSKLQYKCKKTGTIGAIRYHDFQQGQRCGCCRCDRVAQKLKKDIEVVKKEFNDRGYELLTTQYRNAHQPLRFQCPNHPNTGMSITYNSFHQGKGCKLCAIENSRGEKSIHWKGGTTELNTFLRESSDLTKWKIKWLETTKGKCAVCNIRRKGKIHVHHSVSHHQIRDEVLTMLNLPLYQNIGDYTEEQRNAILALYILKHENVEGIPMLKKVHKLFHKLYGINADYEDYQEFKDHWDGGKFC